MVGEGFAIDGEGSLKRNRSLLKRRRTYREIHTLYKREAKSKSVNLKFASKEELAQIRKSIVEREKLILKNAVTWTILIVFALTVVVSIFI